MLNIGSHLSISKGFYAIGRDALSIGANTFQFFTRNPRGGSARKIDIEDVNALIKLMTENNFAKNSRPCTIHNEPLFGKTRNP